MRFTLLSSICLLSAASASYESTLPGMMRLAVTISRQVELASGVNPGVTSKIVTEAVSGVARTRAELCNTYNHMSAILDQDRTSGMSELAEESARRSILTFGYGDELLDQRTLHRFLLDVRDRGIFPVQCPLASSEDTGTALAGLDTDFLFDIVETVAPELAKEAKNELGFGLQRTFYRLMYVHNHGTPDRSRAIEAYKQALLTLVSAILQCRKGALGYIYNNYAA